MSIIKNEELQKQLDNEPITRKDMTILFETLLKKELITQLEYNNALSIINSKYQI